MGLIENIFGAVLLIGVVLAVTLIITLETSENVTVDLAFKQQSFLQEKHQVGLNTVFSLTEPETGQTFDRLVGRSLSNRREVIPVGQNQFNVTQELRTRFNLIFGEGNWHYRVTPRVSTIAVAFVIDGTSSVDPQREVLEQEIETIITRTNYAAREVFEDVTISYYMFISSEDTSKCAVFNTIGVQGFEECFTVTPQQMYAQVYPSPEFAIADVGNLMYDSTVAYEADWLGALVWGARHITESSPDPSGTVALFFPITDEMTTGSVPDECYETNLGDAASASDARANAIMCGFCHGNCPTRSLTQLQAAQTILNDLYTTLVPPVIRSIFIEECDVFYSTIWNEIVTGTPRTAYVDDRFGTQRPAQGQTWCDLSGCPGCQTNPDNSQYICFRSVCWDDTRDQLRALNDMFGEHDIITLTDYQALPGIVMDTVEDEIQRQVREDGVLDLTRNRFAVRYDLFVPGQEIIPFTLWVYEERGFDITTPDIFDTPLLELMDTQGFDSDTIIPGGLGSAYSPEDLIDIRIPAFPGVIRVQVRIGGNTYTLHLEDDYFVGRIALSDFPDDTYDMEIIFQDAQGNIHTETISDAIQVDVNRAPIPELEDARITRNLVRPGTTTDITLTFSRPVTDVSITIEGPSTATQVSTGQTLFTTGDVPLTSLAATRWGVTLQAAETIGTYTVTRVDYQDLYERSFSDPLSLILEVTDVQLCDSASDCTGGEHCWGDTSQELLCNAEQAPSGAYTAEDSACQQGLTRDASTGQCYDATTTYDIVFVPLRYTNLQQFQAFVTQSINGLYEKSPMRECPEQTREEHFRFHIVEDLTCAQRYGCTSTSSIEACITATTSCAQEVFPGIGDRHFGLSTAPWPHPSGQGFVIGMAAGLNSQTMVTSRGYGDQEAHVDIMLHEAGHTWALHHLSAHDANIGPPGGACLGPNNSDCDLDDRYFIMSYNILDHRPNRYGPAGYSIIRDYFLRMQIEACQ